MAPSHTNKKGVRYRYYVSRALLDGEPERAGKPSRIQASEIEMLVTDALEKARAKRWEQGDGHEDAHEHQTPVTTPFDPAHAQSLVDTMLDHVEVYASKIVLTVRAPAGSQNDDGNCSGRAPNQPVNGEEGMLPAACDNISDEQSSNDEEAGDAGYLMRRISIPCRLGYIPPSKKLIPADENAQGPVVPPLPNSQRRNRDRLVIAIHKSRGWLNELLGGKVTDLTEIAAREGKSERNISMMINLAFLAPDIIEAIVKEDAPASLSASHLSQTLPLGWDAQRKLVVAQV